MGRIAPETIHRGSCRLRNNPDWPELSIFAQRARSRPSHLGFSRSWLRKAEGWRLWEADLDVLDDTAVLAPLPLTPDDSVTVRLDIGPCSAAQGSTLILLTGLLVLRRRSGSPH